MQKVQKIKHKNDWGTLDLKKTHDSSITALCGS